ncbi:hypothetical protein PV726_39970 [Streptomyces europaeiscabiei]|uniref:hypothetical protein n=1 Tax=Streptomyces europaeiscabiei TaxID=146819 RepID=UPI0029A6973C|nr:hypothetical protein [Streptomyces europaeiscabiei]MDX3696378.1 hypothetical protein [Streptomyces europaeiscabiei]
MRADIVFTGGTVSTGAAERPVVDALAVTGGRISALGPEALAARGRGTTVVDLPGGALRPAFGDGRVHPVVGGLGLLGAPVRGCTSVDGIVEAVRRWADGHLETESITGDGFDAWLTPGTRISFGSDWPVTDLKPLRGIATAVTRQSPEGIPDGGRLPQERIDLLDRPGRLLRRMRLPGGRGEGVGRPAPPAAGEIVGDVPDEQRANTLLATLAGLQVNALFVPHATTPDRQLAVLDALLPSL